MIIYFVYDSRDKAENFYEPFTKVQVINLLDPPLDTITKNKCQGLYDKYHVTPSLTFRLVKFQSKIADVMIFDTYGKDTLFVVAGHFELLSNDSAQTFRLEGQDTVLFTHKVDPNEWILNVIYKKDESVAKAYIKTGKPLAFVKERERVWRFEPDVSQNPLVTTALY